MDLIQADIRAIIQQYGDKNENIAFIITAVAILIAVWHSVFLGFFRTEEIDFIKYSKRKQLLLGIRRSFWFICLFLFVYYFCYLIELTLLTREAGSRTDINLCFLGTWHPDLRSQCFMVENILLFFPFGILIVFLCSRLKLWKVLLLSFLLSLTIEITQFITERGFFQIDDIWLNTLGGFLGGILGDALKKLGKNLLE